MNKKRLNQSLDVGSRPRKQKNGPFSIAIKLVVVLVVVGFVYSMLFSSVERDMTTLCRSDNAFPRETALLLDTTDGFTSAQALSIKSQLEQTLSQSQIDERFTFYALGPQSNTYYPRFSMCNPGDGLDDSSLSIAERTAYQNWDQQLLQRVGLEIDNLIDAQAAANSPILEMVQYASNQSRWSSQESAKRMIIISTLIHHTPEFSNYVDSSNFRAVPGDYQNRVQAFLEGVEVTLWYVLVPRAVAFQNRNHIEQFWRPFIDSAGGSIAAREDIGF